MPADSGGGGSSGAHGAPQQAPQQPLQQAPQQPPPARPLPRPHLVRQAKAALKRALEQSDDAAQIMSVVVQGANMLLEDLLGDDDADLDPADVALAMPPGMPPRIVQRVLSYCFDRTYQLSPDGFCTIKHPSDYKTRIKPAASDEYFIKMIRLDRAAFFELRNALRPLLKRMPTPMKPNPLSVGEQLWIALRYLASGAPLPTIGEAVHYSTTTVHRCVRDVCCAIITTKRHELVKWPNDDDGIMHLVAGFRSFAGIPNIVGAIDGSNIGIVTPPFSGDAYIDRKGHTSIKLQAVCDADMLFMDLYCGPSGRWHDQRAFRASPLWEELHEGALGARLQRAALEVPVPPATPGGPARVARLPLQVVADSAYTATEFVLPAFQDSTADVGPRRTFNLAHARTRNVIERAFGLLKARWRILLRRIDTKLSTTVHIIAACCILHNICVKAGLEEDAEVAAEARRLLAESEAARAAAAAARAAGPPAREQWNSSTHGSRIRDDIMAYLSGQQ